MSLFAMPPLPSLLGIFLVAAVATGTINFIRESRGRR